MTVQVIAQRGGFVTWDAADTDRASLLSRLANLGLEKYCPDPRSDTQALQIALNEHKRHTRKEMRAGAKHGEKSKLDVAVQGLADRQANGFEVVGIERGEQTNVYSGRYSVKLDEQGRVTVTSGYLDYEQRQSLQRQYEQAKATLGADSIGPTLIELANHLGGTTIRQAGGVYYVPESGLAMWERIIDAFQASGASKVYVARVVMDPQCVRQVKDAIVDEVTERARELAREVSEGSLGPVAIENRLAKAKLLHGRVQEYEGILAETLSHLHAVVAVAEQAAASALAVQEDSSIGVFANA